MVETQLTLIWTGIVGFAVFMYVLMDGFDLGLGILFPFAPSDPDRDIMMNSVAPIWDLMSSPTIGTPAAVNFSAHSGVPAMNTGRAFTNATPASIAAWA